VDEIGEQGDAVGGDVDGGLDRGGDAEPSETSTTRRPARERLIDASTSPWLCP
jgi:hypothetical protein